MRRVSRKRLEAIDNAKEARQKFAWEFPRCMLCGLEKCCMDTHEIARGPSRYAAYAERCTWLRLCRECHEQMGDYSVWPIERQLALKLSRDAAFYSTRVFNEIRGRAAFAVNIRDVVPYLKTLPPLTGSPPRV